MGVNGMKQVKVGVGFGLFRLGMPSAHTIAQVAERAEEWGLDSFWLSDHLLAPSPELDVVATLSLIASRTSRIKLGPSVFLLNLRHPLITARSGLRTTRAFTASSLISITLRSSPAPPIGITTIRELSICG